MNGVDPLPLYQYISGLAWLFVVFIYAPFLLVLSFYLGRKLPFARGWKVSAATLFFLVMLVLPFADVIVAGPQHQALCRKDAGIHIYRTVEVQGYFSEFSSINTEILDRGFSYVEGFRKGKLLRARKDEAGKVVFERIDEPMSRYELGYETEAITPRLDRQYFFVRQLQSDEVLAEAINYGYYWGWADRHIFVGWMGSLPPIRCGLPVAYYTPILVSVLLPKSNTSGVPK